MADISSPFENITSLLGSSAAWKKYFPGISTGAAPSYEGVKPAKTNLPSFKGIDFTTGKPVDLSMYENVGISEASPEPGANELTPPDYTSEASPYSEENLDRLTNKWLNLSRRLKGDEYAYNMAMLDPLRRRILDTAQQTRAMDLAYGSQGLNIREQSPSQVAARGALAQQGMATAAGSEAQMLDAVSNAAYRSAMAQAQGLAPRGRAA